jgi:multidrug efflux pump subunit AcrA (membrane-fusion protein)
MKTAWLGLALAVATIAAGWHGPRFMYRLGVNSPVLGVEWVAVRRTDLHTTLLAGGDLRPVKETTIKCQVEDLTDSDGTMVLSMIPSGSHVRKGEELCRLDSAPLEDLAREQQVLLNQARATCLAASLVLETARSALAEYEQGLVLRSIKEFEGRLALGRSDLKRQADRVAWTDSMVAKGYLSQGLLLTERQSLALAGHELRKAEGEFEVFRRFEVPRAVRELRCEVETAMINFRLEVQRTQSEEDRLTHLRKQIEHCTIRAPKDGIVVHAGDRWWMGPLKAGMLVYEEQELFTIPDLSEMEIHVSVHESMGSRVRAGTKARVRVVAHGDRIFSGRVADIDQIPSVNWKHWDENLKHLIARVRFDRTPPGLLPFMSAIVEFDTGMVPDALVIPAEAVLKVDGRACCDVLTAGGVKRRAISTSRGTTDLLEVTDGLEEGDCVVIPTTNGAGKPG